MISEKWQVGNPFFASRIVLVWLPYPNLVLEEVLVPFSLVQNACGRDAAPFVASCSCPSASFLPRVAAVCEKKKKKIFCFLLSAFAVVLRLQSPQRSKYSLTGGSAISTDVIAKNRYLLVICCRHSAKETNLSRLAAIYRGEHSIHQESHSQTQQ